MIPFVTWQAKRLAALTAEDGWLNLTDRVEIPPGAQRLGSAPDNDLILSVGPGHLGTLTADATTAQLTTARPIKASMLSSGLANEGPTTDGLTAADQTQIFTATATNPNPVLRVGDLLLELHTVEGQPALRVRDLTLPRAIALPAYPFDPAWVILARWQALAAPQAQSNDQKGAGPIKVTLTHRAHFSRGGYEIALLATHWKQGLPMFVIRDATSGTETYPASRFLIAEPEGDTITLDFNRAHNPPCAFTDFAICPLPPRENRLAFAVRAGERKLV